MLLFEFHIHSGYYPSKESFANIFSHSASCFFILLIIPFVVQTLPTKWTLIVFLTVSLPSPCVCVRAHACAHVWTFLKQTGSFSDLKPTNLPRLTGQQVLGILVLPSRAVELWARPSVPVFYLSWELNSGPHDCILQTKPSPPALPHSFLKFLFKSLMHQTKKAASIQIANLAWRTW